MKPLSEAERDELLNALPGWKRLAGRDAIERELRFADFNEAFSFMGRVALLAERMDHHPEWSNNYDRVRIVLTTHSTGGLSNRDAQMARAIERYVAALVRIEPG